MNKIFFWRYDHYPLTHKEFIALAKYRDENPDDELNLVMAHPTDESHFNHLAMSLNCALMPLDSEVPKGHPPYKLDVASIKDNKLLTYPFFHMGEFVSRGVKGEILDLGCGNKGFAKYIPTKVVTVDIFEKFKPNILWDLNNTPLPFCDNSYEVVLLMDVIEHLEKEKGFKLLEEAKRITTKRVFIFTPLWWTENKENAENPESDYYQNKYDLHRSLWEIEDFKGFIRVENKLVRNYFFGYWEKNEKH